MEIRVVRDLGPLLDGMAVGLLTLCVAVRVYVLWGLERFRWYELPTDPPDVMRSVKIYWAVRWLVLLGVIGMAVIGALGHVSFEVFLVLAGVGVAGFLLVELYLGLRVGVFVTMSVLRPRYVLEALEGHKRTLFAFQEFMCLVGLVAYFLLRE